MPITIVISIIGFIGIIGSLIWLVILAFKKHPKKSSLIGVGISVILFLVGYIPSPPVAASAPASDNKCNVKYEDVSSFIQNALNDMGVSEVPNNISIESFETSGTISATINFQIAEKQLSAGCFKDGENKNWYLVDISGGTGKSQKFYWLSDNIKDKQDLYDFKTDKLISEKLE